MNTLKGLLDKAYKIIPVAFWSILVTYGVLMAKSLDEAKEDSTWGATVSIITSWIGGGLGTLMALGAFLIGIVTAISISQGKAIAVASGLVVALAIQVGPTVYAKIAGASLGVSHLAMWALA